jgi:hypothetical protein
MNPVSTLSSHPYYPPIYSLFYQLVSSLSGLSPKVYIHFSSFPCALHVPPILLELIALIVLPGEYKLCTS